MVITEEAVWVGEQGRISRIDPETDKILGAVEVPFQDYFFDVGFGSAWVPEFEASVVHRYSLESGEEEATIEVGPNPEYVAVSPDAVWVSNHRGGSVSRVDPARDAVVATISVGPEGPIGPSDIIYAAGRIWVAIPNIRAVARIDPATNEVDGTASLGGVACELSFAGELVWAQSCHEELPYLGAIEPATGELVGPVRLAEHAGSAFAVGDAAWVPLVGPSPPGSVVRIDPETLTVVDTVSITFPAAWAYTGFDSVWIALKTRVLRLPIAAFARD
jgi:DNA-binding beta-propeller fold protein YncE